MIERYPAAVTFSRNQLFLFLVALIVCSATILFVYTPGLSGGLHFDDSVNLRGLKVVAETGNYIDFVLSGIAGPTGRPVALLSFVPQAASWPNQLKDLLLVNVYIHIANFYLLVLLGVQIISLYTRSLDKNVVYIALTAAFLWAILPINVSATLIVVQRMTGLSALFSLIAINGFLAGYWLASKNTKFIPIFQLLWLGFFSAISMCAKENGALTPIFALLIDRLLLSQYSKNNEYFRFVRLVLVGLLIGLLLYLSPIFLSWEYSEYRGFSALERVNTQAVILWQYLKLILLPIPSEFSPYHDDYRIIQSVTTISLAYVAWASSIALAVALKRKSIWFIFGILWFLSAHLIESTSIKLELYYEHRNYLASYGVILSITAMIWYLKKRVNLVFLSSYWVYILLVSVICYSITSLWGTPKKAASFWAQAHPGSARVVNYMTRQYDHKAPNAIENWRVIMPYLDSTAAVCPKCLDVQMQAIIFSCKIESPTKTRQRLNVLSQNAIDGRVTPGLVDGVFPLSDWIESGNCPGVSHRDLFELIGRFLANKRVLEDDIAVRLYFHRATAAMRIGDYDGAVFNLRLAEQVSAIALPILKFQVNLFLDHQDIQSARAAIDRRRMLVGESDSDLLTIDVLRNLDDQIESYSDNVPK